MEVEDKTAVSWRKKPMAHLNHKIEQNEKKIEPWSPEGRAYGL